MKKVLKFAALLFGAVALITGTSSCKKEECCSYTDDYGSSYKFCEDDAILESSPLSWEYFKNLAIEYGGSCKKE